ncbi:MAG: hypothetical protein ACRDT0_27325 [Pseudonocardiaceae bacterium]
MKTELAEPADPVPDPDESGDLGEPAATVRAAEQLLTARLGAPVELADPEDLGGSGRSVVLRVRVARNPFSLPRTLVVKHATTSAPCETADSFAREVASCQLFTALHADDRPGPALIASDSDQRLLVLEDLGRSGTVAGALLAGDSAHAQRSLLGWARALGRLHAATAGREPDFAALLRRQGRRDACDPVQRHRRDALDGLPMMLDRELDVATGPEVCAEAKHAGELLDGVRYRAFSPADLGPDNAVVVGRTVRFIDFEGGGFRTALLDAAQLGAPLPSSFWSGYALPRGVAESMLSAWRDEAAVLWPELGDRAAAAGLLLDGQLLWTWLCTWWLLPGPEVPARGGVLVDRWGRLAEDAATLDRTALAEHADAVRAALCHRFDVHGPPLPVYPALA